eukprot:scaffold56013_cov18-Tisochrysis_lutea.AAC.3
MLAAVRRPAAACASPPGQRLLPPIIKATLLSPTTIAVTPAVAALTPAEVAAACVARGAGGLLLMLQPRSARAQHSVRRASEVVRRCEQDWGHPHGEGGARVGGGVYEGWVGHQSQVEWWSVARDQRRGVQQHRVEEAAVVAHFH